jgi:hypothetical protein
MAVRAASLFRRVWFLKRRFGFEHRCALAHACAVPSELSTMHRRLQTWRRDEILRLVLTDMRRTEIKPNHIAQLLDEEGIGRKLEAADTVRSQTSLLRPNWCRNKRAGASRLRRGA